MAKAKDTAWLDGAEKSEPAAPAPVSGGSVKVLSLREGDIIMPEGTLRFKQTMQVSAEKAEWLVKTFPQVSRL